MNVQLRLLTLGVTVWGNAGCPATAASSPTRPIELGDVGWRRDWVEGTGRSAQGARDDRPVLLLFTEVPGCSTVQGFGRGPLRDPLLVEAIDTLFSAQLVYNNRSGADAALLARFAEPSWNNPVVRIVDASGAALAPRFSGPYEVAAVARLLVQALTRARRPVPRYLELLGASAGPRQRAVLAMSCFWSGEVELGGLSGVLATRPGHLDGREVVEVEFASEQLSFAQLLSWAVQRDVASHVFARDEAQARIARRMLGAGRVTATREPVGPAAGDLKKQLAATEWRFVPLTATQSARVNAWVGTGRGHALELLSPRQRALHAAVVAHPTADWPNQLAQSWPTGFARAERVRLALAREIRSSRR